MFIKIISIEKLVFEYKVKKNVFNSMVFLKSVWLWF